MLAQFQPSSGQNWQEMAEIGGFGPLSGKLIIQFTPIFILPRTVWAIKIDLNLVWVGILCLLETEKSLK